MATTTTSSKADKYRGATVEDLDPPPALSVSPHQPIHAALLTALSHDYTHLTVVHPTTRALLGYVSVPRLQAQLAAGVAENEPVERAMQTFARKRRAYRLITPATPLEQLEDFFDGAASGGERQGFAVVTDEGRKFVVGVATREDLEEFVRRRPR